MPVVIMESTESKNCIFLTFDDVYYKYARICLNSLAANYPEHPPVKVLYSGKSPEIIAALSEMPKVEVLSHELDVNQFASLNICQLGSAMVYARFILWTDLLDQFDKILYLDCDTIILKPFPELFEREGFFAVSDNGFEKVFDRTKLTNPELLAALEKDGLNLESVNEYMANSGFFIIPREYRTKEHLSQLWSITNTYNDYFAFADQSAISIWMYMNSIPLSEEYQYNFQTQFLFKDTLQIMGADNVKVMHYSGWKPDKNFHELLVPANYIFSIRDNFNKYNK
jgi:lipopolysaccharide biosynthesis glycosyltransferase